MGKIALFLRGFLIVTVLVGFTFLVLSLFNGFEIWVWKMALQINIILGVILGLAFVSSESESTQSMTKRTLLTGDSK